jgi:hypothetical protein
MVRIFSDKNGSGEFVIQTTATDTDTYIGELAEAMHKGRIVVWRRRRIGNDGDHEKRNANRLQAVRLQSRVCQRAENAGLRRNIS